MPDAKPSTYRVLTGPQPAGIAVIAIEGPLVASFLQRHFSRSRPIAATPLVAPLVHGMLSNAAGDVIDDPVVAWFDEFTAELSLHGGSEILRQAVTLLEAAGFAAQPGLPATLDLTSRAEDLLPFCRTELAVRTLLTQPGHPSLKYLLQPPTVAIIGPPNVGKSTLFNALAGEQASITADMPGTTRDYVLAEADLDGLIVRLIDTPGQRDTTDAIEARAIEIALNAIGTADLHVLVVDAGSDPTTARDLLARYPYGFVVAARADLVAMAHLPKDHLPVSATAGIGMNELRSAIRGRFLHSGASHLRVEPSLQAWQR